RVHRLVVDDSELKPRSAADQRLGSLDILHARQLHHHAIIALADDGGLRDPELIDAVADDLDALIERILPDILPVLARKAELELAWLLACDPKGPKPIALQQVVKRIPPGRIELQQDPGIVRGRA